MKKGFTLVEMLVAITIFLIVTGSVMSIFVNSVKNQRVFLARHELLSQTGYAMEYMSKSIRMAKKDVEADCITANANYESGGADIRFMDYKGQCQEFSLSGTALMGGSTPLTSPNIEVLAFNITGKGVDQTDDLQPRITVFLHARGNFPGLSDEAQPEIKIQTSISQRNLDVAR